MAKIKYGYVRVSTTGQKEDRQLDELLKYGIDLSCIYVDNQSGKDFQRSQYIKLYENIFCAFDALARYRLRHDFLSCRSEWY